VRIGFAATAALGVDVRLSGAQAQQVALARLAAAIERAAADLGLEEEPARFVVALDDGADREAGP